MTTTLDNRARAFQIALEMRQAGESEAFALKAAELAGEWEGVFDLMVLWREADTNDDKEETIIALQETIDDIEHTPRRQDLPKIPYEHLDAVKDEVLAFKAELRKKVDQWGGISRLARETGIPQPSLSRFFNSPSLPRRTTLYKIASATGLAAIDVEFRHTA